MAVLLIAGVLTAGDRRRAVAGSELALALGAGAVLGGLALVRTVLPTVIPASVMPNEVSQLLLATVTDGLSNVVAVVLALGFVVALLGWLTGSGRTPARLRAAATTVTTRLRTGRDRLGLDPGGFGRWLYSARVWVRVLVSAAAIAFLAANRPLSPGLIIGTAAVAMAVLALAGLLWPAVPDAGADKQPAPVGDG